MKGKRGEEGPEDGGKRRWGAKVELAFAKDFEQRPLYPRLCSCAPSALFLLQAVLEDVLLALASKNVIDMSTGYHALD